jgi:hypothetical protein
LPTAATSPAAAVESRMKLVIEGRTALLIA